MVSARPACVNPVSWICPSCARQQYQIRRFQRVVSTPCSPQKRHITQAYVKREEEAAEQWQEKHRQIRAGERQSMFSILEQRGYINAVAGGSKENLDSLMIQKRVGAYIGIDPTAPSLHVGHLVPLMALFWMYLHGFHSITLIGGATAGIGDPTGRTKDRDKLSQHVRKANMVTMHYQLKALWMNVEKQGRTFGYEWEWAWRRGIHNNNTWWNSLPFLEVLRLLGSGTRVGTMLGRDTAKNKMESRDGLSFAEFSYPLLQAYDWWRMYSTFQLNGIQLQIGGSDQYGNILAGVEAVDHIRRTHYSPEVRQEEDLFTNRPMGFTVPLLTTSSGEKFGKSTGNAVWLDKDMTSPFDFYQFFLRSADDDVRRYLNLFTFIPVKEIDQIMVEHESDASRRVAQRRLAREVLMMVHGEAEVKAVEAQHGILFKPSRTALKREARAARTPQEPEQKTTKPADLSPLLNRGVGPDKISPAGQVILPRSLVVNQQLGRVFYAVGLVSSRSEGHRLIAKQGAWIGSVAGPQHRAMPDHVEFTRAGNWTNEYINKFIIDDQLLIIRAGKWRVRVIKIVADSEFERLGLDVPGWKDFKQSQQREAEGQKADGSPPSSGGPQDIPTQSRNIQ